MPAAELSEPEYLRHVEHLARKVVAMAKEEGWLSHGDDPAELTPLQQVISQLDDQIRHHHFAGDGCVDDSELPLMKLAGIVVLRPEAMPAGMAGTYDEICARLGVDARPEGWAIWNTWAADGQPVSIVMVDLEGTEGVLMNWTRGIEVYPVTPLPAQVVLARQGWVTPMTLSRLSARKLGTTRPVCWSPADG